MICQTTVEGINITALDLYLDDYPSGADSNHPKHLNWTGYIIDIGGFVIFHAGDAKYMTEYESFPADVDVAVLLEHGKYSTCAVLASKDTYEVRILERQFLKEFETKFDEKLRQFMSGMVSPLKAEELYDNIF